MYPSLLYRLLFHTTRVPYSSVDLDYLIGAPPTWLIPQIPVLHTTISILVNELQQMMSFLGMSRYFGGCFTSLTCHNIDDYRIASDTTSLYSKPCAYRGIGARCTNVGISDSVLKLVKQVVVTT